MAQKRREFSSKKRYLISLIIGTIFFLLIFGLSYSLSYLQLQRTTGFQADTSYGIFEDNLYHSFFNEPLCGGASLERISEDLGFQGRVMEDLEVKLGKQDPAVLARKKFYTLVELEHFEFVRNINEECNGQVNTILFFYSNNASERDASDNAGRILGVVSQRHENLVIYSFDVDLDSELMQKLKAKYNVTDVPVVIVNEIASVKMPANVEFIEGYFY